MIRAKKKYHRSHSKISMEEAEKIAIRLKNGEYGYVIAKEYEVSTQSIVRIRNRFAKKTKSIRYPKSFREEVISQKENLTISELAKKYNLQYMTVYRWVKGIHKIKYERKIRTNWRVPGR